MSIRIHKMSKYGSMEDLLRDECKDQQEKIQALESEIELYQKALTMAVQLPMGVIPHGDGFYTQMDNGVCVVKKESGCE